MKKEFSLPEKEYFTREELAKRWDCDHDLVDYYIDSGVLRQAWYAPRSSNFMLEFGTFLQVDASSPLFKAFRSRSNDVASCAELVESANVEISHNTFANGPIFAYVNDSAAFSSSKEPVLSNPFHHPDSHSSKQQRRIYFLEGFGSDRYIPVAWSANEWHLENMYEDDSMQASLIIPREERNRFEAGIPIDAMKRPSFEISSTPIEMTATTEKGYLVTIGMLARLLSTADGAYAKPDSGVNVQAMAQALEKVNMSLDGHRFEVLKKRISAGLKELHDLS